MDRLPTRVNRVDPDYQKRRTHNLRLIETWQTLDVSIKEGAENMSKDIEVAQIIGS